MFTGQGMIFYIHRMIYTLSLCMPPHDTYNGKPERKSQESVVVICINRRV